jgi:signal transduction histidine kinase
MHPNAPKNANALRLLKLGKYCATATGIIALVVLTGWIFKIDAAKRILPEFVAMNPATAVCFIFSVISVFLITEASKKTSHKITGYALAITVLIMASLKLTGIIMNKEVFIDTTLFHDALNEPGRISNSMAPNTAISFILLALSLLLINISRPGHKLPSQYVSIILGIFSLLSVLGYLYRVKFFYGFYNQIPMALPTAFGFLLMSFAVLFTHPEKGITGELTRTRSGATAAAFLIPSAVLIPTILGYLRLYIEWKGFLELEFGTSLLILSIILLLLLIIWFTIKTLNHRDDLRRQAEESLSAVNKELSAFTYSVSHDLRAPLRAMNSYSSILLKDHSADLNDEAKQFLASIQANALRMGNLVDDLLKFSHLGKKEIERTVIDMNVLTREVIDQLNRTMPHKAEISVAPLHNINGDTGLIRQAMTNLISNAIKYSSRKEKPQVRIESAELNGIITFKIIDNGAGFDMKFADKLFGVFQRLHNQDEFEGTGVGLAIVHRIITKHGGQVWAESILGEGAAFYFSLPKDPRIRSNHLKQYI